MNWKENNFHRILSSLWVVWWTNLMRLLNKSWLLLSSINCGKQRHRQLEILLTLADLHNNKKELHKKKNRKGKVELKIPESKTNAKPIFSNGKTLPVSWEASDKERNRSFLTSISFSLLWNSKDVEKSVLEKRSNKWRNFGTPTTCFSIHCYFHDSPLSFRSLKPKSHSNFTLNQGYIFAFIHFEFTTSCFRFWSCRGRKLRLVLD